MFTPAKVKADLVFVASLVAVFGFNIPTTISAAIVGSAGFIAALLNFGDLIANKYDPQLLPAVLGEVKTFESDVEKLLPSILPVLEQLPGKIGQEVAEAIKNIENEAKGQPVPASKATKGA